MHFANKCKLIGLLNFIYTVIGGNVDCLVVMSSKYALYNTPKIKREDINENMASFILGFSSIEIKSDDEYQIEQWVSSDNYCPILYHMMHFIQ